eukprot:2815450-Rhodomonas_salina.1
MIAMSVEEDAAVAEEGERVTGEAEKGAAAVQAATMNTLARAEEGDTAMEMTARAEEGVTAMEMTATREASETIARNTARYATYTASSWTATCVVLSVITTCAIALKRRLCESL